MYYATCFEKKFYFRNNNNNDFNDNNNNVSGIFLKIESGALHQGAERAREGKPLEFNEALRPARPVLFRGLQGLALEMISGRTLN